MRSNSELSTQEFEVSKSIKRALLYIEDPLRAKEYLYAALRALHA